LTRSTISSYKVSYESMMELAKVFNKIHDKMVKIAEKIEKHEARLLQVSTPGVTQQPNKIIRFNSFVHVSTSLQQ